MSASYLLSPADSRTWTFLSNKEDILDFISHITTYLAIDTEFIRNNTYFPQGSLIQLEANGTIALIDLLDHNCPPLDDFLPVLENTNITKIFHAARGDLEILFSLFHIIPHPIFDTQTASMICGIDEQISYSQMVEILLQKDTGPSFQKTDWSIRPLTPEKIQYATFDVLYLKACHDILAQKLQDLGRISWKTEEMNTLANPKSFTPSPEEAWKKITTNIHSIKQKHALHMLAAWRETQAIRQNKPKNWILPDDALIKLSLMFHKKELPSSHFLKAWKDITHVRYTKEGEALYQSIMDSIIHTHETTNKQENQTADEYAVTLLKLLRKHHAQNLKIPPKFLCSNDDIKEIALHPSFNAKDHPLKALTSWRLEHFGYDALALMHGTLSLSYKPNAIVLHTHDHP